MMLCWKYCHQYICMRKSSVCCDWFKFCLLEYVNVNPFVCEIRVLMTLNAYPHTYQTTRQKCTQTNRMLGITRTQSKRTYPVAEKNWKNTKKNLYQSYAKRQTENRGDTFTKRCILMNIIYYVLLQKIKNGEMTTNLIKLCAMCGRTGRKAKKTNWLRLAKCMLCLYGICACACICVFVCLHFISSENSFWICNYQIKSPSLGGQFFSPLILIVDFIRVCVRFFCSVDFESRVLMHAYSFEFLSLPSCGWKW